MDQPLLMPFSSTTFEAEQQTQALEKWIEGSTGGTSSLMGAIAQAGKQDPCITDNYFSELQTICLVPFLLVLSGPMIRHAKLGQANELSLLPLIPGYCDCPSSLQLD